MRTAVFTSLVMLVCSIALGLPVAWESAAEAAIEADPVAGELSPASPGLETVYCSGGQVRCLDATGAGFWTYAPDAPATWRGVALAVAGGAEGVAEGARVLALSDAALVCLDGALGQPLWQAALPGLAGTCPVWADLDGDGSLEAVAATTAGLAVFDAQGAPRWTYPEAGSGDAFVPAASPAVADADGDGLLETYAISTSRLVCLEQDGYLRWEWEPETPLAGAPTVADANSDAVFEVYCQSADGVKLYVLDAAYGDPLWEAEDAKAVATTATGGAEVLVAGLNADRMAEVIAVTTAGRMCVYTAEGKPLWCFHDDQPAPRHAAVGDVDGDGIREILLAAGKTLYCLSEAGTPEWRLQFGGLLTQAPMLADVDGDTKTEVVLAGAEDGGAGLVQCFDAEGPALAPMLPWPMARGGVMRQGAAPRFEDLEDVLYWDTQPVLEAGFNLPQDTSAEARKPAGWTVEPEDVTWALDAETRVGGTASVRVEPVGGKATLVSAPALVTGEVREISGSVLAKGDGALRALVRWQGTNRPVEPATFRRLDPNDAGWRRFVLDPLAPPLGTRAAVLVLEAEGGAPVWWDEAQLGAELLRVPKLEILYNQLGYDATGSKSCTIRMNFEAMDLALQLVRTDGEVAHVCALQDAGKIRGAYGHDWGYMYYRGVFSEYAKPGKYLLRAVADETAVSTAPFLIEEDLLWNTTLTSVVGAFSAYRWPSGPEAPDCLQAVVPGGWMDGSGCHNRNTALYAWLLATAHKATLWKQQEEEEKPGIPLFKEALHVTDWLTARADAGEPDPLVAAAAARLALLAEDDPALIAAARTALRRAAAAGAQSPMLFNAAWDLFMATGDESDAKQARELMPGPNAETIDALLEYEAEFDELLSVGIAVQLIEQADALIARSDNAYGVCPYMVDGQRNFFNTPASGETAPGNTAHVLAAAELVAKAYKFNPVPAYRDFVYNQLNWVLGCNPYGVSLVNGVGTRGVSAYHHCPCAPGAPEGAIAHGLTGRAPGDDRPWLDMAGGGAPAERTNGFSLLNNALWISTLGQLERVRVGGM